MALYLKVRGSTRQVADTRKCGTCTKCCEGWLRATINGVEMSPGKPCYLLEIGRGCSDYENRPESPCKTFVCAWLEDLQIPDEFKPERCNVILVFEEVEGIPFLGAYRAPDNPSAELVTWLVAVARNSVNNIFWEIGDAAYWMGSKEFVEAMQKHNTSPKK
jgi:hypothetical protein